MVLPLLACEYSHLGAQMESGFMGIPTHPSGQRHLGPAGRPLVSPESLFVTDMSARHGHSPTVDANHDND
jgi:hypothetical protein